MLSRLWHTYTQEILSWKLGTATAHTLAEPLSCTKDIEIEAQRLMRHIQRQGEYVGEHVGKHEGEGQKKYLILLGSNAPLCTHLQNLIAQCGLEIGILVLESCVSTARAFAKTLTTDHNFPTNATAVHIDLLVDTSPWALFMLTKGAGLIPSQCVLHWSQKPQGRCPILQQWRKLFLASTTVHMDEHDDTANEHFYLRVGAILHPDEPNLEDFFAQIPAFVDEVVVIWDMPPVNNNKTHHAQASFSYTCNAAIHHIQRPLENNFAAQRNAILEFCSQDTRPHQWLLMLDADERLAPYSWKKLITLIQHCQKNSIEGVLFPRLTFEKNIQNVRMGHGLWPDIQLRLFKYSQHIRYTNSIHEALTGLKKGLLLTAHMPIWHYSHVLKNAHELRQRLEVFNKAGSTTHQLSDAYPCLAKPFFKILEEKSVQAGSHIQILPTP